MGEIVKYYIGIEGISMRHCVGVVSDAHGNILSGRRLDGVPLSLHTTHGDELREGLLTLLRELSIGAGLRLRDLRSGSICIGLTGVTFPFESQVHLPTELKRIGMVPQKLLCTGDAEIAFVSHSQFMDGGIIICHMGSSVMLAKGPRLVRFGGWGPLIGDEGSGYWMGRAALKAIADEYDTREQRGHESLLWRRIDEWLARPDTEVPSWVLGRSEWRQIRSVLQKNQLDPRQAIFAFAHRMSRMSIWDWRCIVSGLSIPLGLAAGEGDSVANGILKNASDHLLQQFVHGANSMRIASGEMRKIVLYGAIFTRSDKVKNMLQPLLHQKFPQVKFILPGDPGTMRPVFGALLFAIGQGGNGHFYLPPTDIVDNLRFLQAKLHSSGELQND